VGKGRLKERCGLDPQTNFFSFKKSPKTECGLDSRIYNICTSNQGKYFILMPQNFMLDRNEAHILRGKLNVVTVTTE
jgi:hypothetical protein